MSTLPPGRNLEQALGSQLLSPAAGAALADDLLAQLEKVHAGGVAHGYVRPGLVRLQPDGTATLTPAPAPGDDRSRDVRAVAELVCGALGIAPVWSPAEPLRESERAAPALAATLRALAQGSLPLDAAGARAALHEAAGGLADEEARATGRAELASLAGTAAPAHHAPTVTLPVPGRRRRPPLLTAAVIAGGLLLLGAAGVLGWSTAGHRPPAGTAARSAPPTPRTAASASPAALPSLPPASGPIRSVAETPQSTCEPGRTCRIEVDVHFVKTDAPVVISWQFELVDSCTSDATYVQGGSVKALKGWVHVVGDTDLALPAGHPLAIVAITTAPSQASSPPLLITGAIC